MNDKPLKIAAYVGLLNYVDHETPRYYFVSSRAGAEDVKEFAEELVTCCISFCDETSATKIKQHFGML